MSNNLKRIIDIIKNFFHNLFKKTNLMLNKPQENNTVKIYSNVPKVNSIDEIKAENKKNKTIQEIIDITEKNPEILKNLNADQLELIDNYYVEKNKKMKEQVNLLYKKIDIVKKELNAVDQIIEKYNLKSNN